MMRGSDKCAFLRLTHPGATLGQTPLAAGFWWDPGCQCRCDRAHFPSFPLRSQPSSRVEISSEKPLRGTRDYDEGVRQVRFRQGSPIPVLLRAKHPWPRGSGGIRAVSAGVIAPISHPSRFVPDPPPALRCKCTFSASEVLRRTKEGKGEKNEVRSLNFANPSEGNTQVKLGAKEGISGRNRGSNRLVGWGTARKATPWGRKRILWGATRGLRSSDGIRCISAGMIAPTPPPFNIILNTRPRLGSSSEKPLRGTRDYDEGTRQVRFPQGHPSRCYSRPNTLGRGVLVGSGPSVPV
ncbi:hypothetical protein Ancab_002193 [Ancistrocladus abbreviatus]